MNCVSFRAKFLYYYIIIEIHFDCCIVKAILIDFNLIRI